jgi:hypothetical protein
MSIAGLVAQASSAGDASAGGARSSETEVGPKWLYWLNTSTASVAPSAAELRPTASRMLCARASSWWANLAALVAAIGDHSPRQVVVGAALGATIAGVVFSGLRWR